LFWRRDAATDAGEPLDPLRMLAMLLLLASSPLLVYFAAPVLEYLDATAAQLLNPDEYIQQVLSTQPFALGAQP
jgi:multicomponent K+:H+ antiporter subunit D